MQAVAATGAAPKLCARAASISLLPVDAAAAAILRLGWWSTQGADTTDDHHSVVEPREPREPALDLETPPQPPTTAPDELLPLALGRTALLQLGDGVRGVFGQACVLGHAALATLATTCKLAVMQ